LWAVRQALHHYVDERIWKRIQLNGMEKDFSWKHPAAEYAKLYEAAWVLRGGKPVSNTGSTTRGQAGAGRAAAPAARNQKPVATSN
jgi:hypothetical protein